MYLVPSHSLKGRMKEGISTPRIPETDCLIHFPSGPTAGQGQSQRFERQNMPPLSSGDAEAAETPAIGTSRLRPSPLTCPGLKQRPRPGGSPGRLRRQARKRIGRAASRRASCRGPGNGGEARTRSSPRPVACMCHTHLPRPGPASSPHPRGSGASAAGGRNTAAGGPGHTEPAPGIPGLAADSGTFAPPTEAGISPTPGTHPLAWVLPPPPRPPKSQLAHPHAHLSLSYFISPGTHSSSQNSGSYSEAQKPCTPFSSASPEAARAAISPR